MPELKYPVDYTGKTTVGKTTVPGKNLRIPIYLLTPQSGKPRGLGE